MKTRFSTSAFFAVVLACAALLLICRPAYATITITKVAIKDKTNGGEVAEGLADALLSVSFVSAATTDCEDPTLTYTWRFGDGTTATGQNVSHTYGAGGAGNRKVWVEVIDNCGGSVTSVSLTVSAIAAIQVTQIGDIAAPAANGRLCFDGVRNVAATASCWGKWQRQN